MIRLLWYVVLMLTALAAAAAQLDRQSRTHPALSGSVPAYFRGFAHRQLVDDAIARKDYPAALAQARAFVADRPIPAENLVALAKAAFLNGNVKQTAAALSAAGARGWRDPVAQDVVAVAALQDGDMTVAAQRVAAMWAIAAPQARVDTLTDQLLSSQVGRQAFAVRLAGGGRWQGQFISAQIAQTNPAGFADTLVRAGQLGFHFDCPRLQRAADGLLRAGRQDLAAQIRADRCGKSGPD